MKSADMKILVFTLALGFLSGTHGAFLWKKDYEPEIVVENAVRHAAKLGEKSLQYLEESDIGKELKIKENVERASIWLNDFRADLQKSIEEAFAEVYKEMNEKFPVFMTKVLPPIKGFYAYLYEQKLKTKKEVQIAWYHMADNVKKNIEGFYENLQSIAESNLEKMRTEVENLRSSLQPHLEAFREELEKNDIKKIEVYGNKEMEEFLEKLKQMVPHANELQKELDKMLDELEKVASKYV